MATQRTTFAKLQRERDRQARASAKRDRKLAGAAGGADTGIATPDGPLPETLSANELLALVEKVHQQYQSGEIDLDEFDELKRDLLSRLPIE